MDSVSNNNVNGQLIMLFRYRTYCKDKLIKDVLSAPHKQCTPQRHSEISVFLEIKAPKWELMSSLDIACIYIPLHMDPKTKNLHTFFGHTQSVMAVHTWTIQFHFINSTVRPKQYGNADNRQKCCFRTGYICSTK